MDTSVKILFSTFIAAAAMTSTAWAEGTTIDKVYSESEITSSGTSIYEKSGIQESTEMSFDGETVLDTTASKYFFYTDGDLKLSGDGMLDVSSATRFYFMDTVIASGEATENVNFDNIATVTIAEGTTLKGYINLGQAIDNSDVDENGLATRDGGAINMIVDGVLDQKNFYIASGSTLTVSQTGKVTHSVDGSDNHVRAGAKLIVNGNGKDGDVQFSSDWVNVRGGEIEFNNTNAETGTLRFNEDNDNALVSGDTSASLTITDSKVKIYALEIGNIDSGAVINNDLFFKATNSDVLVETAVETRGQFSVAGTSTFNANKLTSLNEVTFGGGYGDARSAITLGSASGKGLTISASRLNLYNADITLTDNVSVTTTGFLSKIQNAVVDMGGKTLSYKGFLVLDSYEEISTPGSGEGVTLKNGTLSVDTNHLCFQGFDHTVAEDAVINVDSSAYDSGMVNVYGTTAIYGQVNVDHGASGLGYGNIGHASYTVADGYPKSELTVSGENAVYSVKSGHMFHVFSGTDVAAAGVLTVEKGASFSFVGKGGDTGLFYNGNIVNVDAESSFVVDSYYGYDGSPAVKGAFNSTTAGEMVVLGTGVVVNNKLVTDSLILGENAILSAGSVDVANLSLGNGSSLTAGTLKTSGSITLNNATLKVTGTLTNTGTLTMLGASSIVSDDNGAGVEIGSISVKTESGAVSLNAASSIVFAGLQEITDIANGEITLEANESVAVAWHFDVETSDSVTVETTLEAGLDASRIKLFHKGDADDAWAQLDNNAHEVSYDASTGRLSFKTNSFSSYAVAIPEPSTFGLFAGLGALFLVGARRRRRN